MHKVIQHKVSRASLFAACLGLALGASAQQTATVLTDAKLNCAAPFKVEGNRCVIDDEKFGPLKTSEPNCKATPGLAWVGGTCHVNLGKEPEPTCSVGALPAKFDTQLRQCVPARETPRSDKGDYLGDCFTIAALPNPAPQGLVVGNSYMVMHQTGGAGQDKTLRLAKANGKGYIWCRAEVFTPKADATAQEAAAAKAKAAEFDILASDLIAVGPDRRGWAYGVLALPYRFHTDDKSFSPTLSLGPYVGRRWGTPGSGLTLAAAATLSSVKGEIKDGNVITGTPDLLAFSVAMGVMSDISKSPELRPFKAGLFFGADFVGRDQGVNYRHNRKPWISLQIGYDFTDN